MNLIDEGFEDVMEGLAWGKRGIESDNVEIQRRDVGSIKVDYSDDDVYFIVAIRQVRRDDTESSVHLNPR